MSFLAAPRALAAGIGTLALLPFMLPHPYYLHLLSTAMIYAIVLVGLDVVVGYTGQLSLGHAGLFGAGAYATGVLVHALNAPWWLTLPASVAVAAGCGALLALPVLRVSGPHLAMVTLGFGSILQILLNEMSFLTQGPLGITLTRPSWNGTPLGERGFFWLTAGCLLTVLVLVQRMLDSHVGRAFQALRDSPVAADCSGIAVYRHKVYAFVVSAGLAGLAGGLYAYSEQYIAPGTFGFDLSMWFVVGLLMGGRKSRTGALLGAGAIVLLPPLLDDVVIFRSVCSVLALVIVVTAGLRVHHGRARLSQVLVPVSCSAALAVLSFVLDGTGDWRWTFFGLITLLVVHDLPGGIVSCLCKPKWLGAAMPCTSPAQRAGYMRRLLGVQPGVRTTPLALPPLPPAPRPPTLAEGAMAATSALPLLLTVRGLAVQFGGLRALDHVDLQVRMGSIHGLIGPNGSGKTTLMNVLSGLHTPMAGRLRFNGCPLTERSAAMIAQSGIGRTFQTAQLFNHMSVLEHVLVGRHHALSGRRFDALLRPQRYRNAVDRAQERALQLLQFVDMAEMANERAGDLPPGHQRLLEIARALALDPQLLLLDEPAAGLPAADVRHLVALMRKMRARGVTLLLIEHRMDVVMTVCDTISVLDFGRKIFEGTPAQAREDPRVIEAYLGRGLLEHAC